MIPHSKIPNARGFTVDIANLLCEPNEIVFMTIPTATAQPVIPPLMSRRGPSIAQMADSLRMEIRLDSR